MPETSVLLVKAFPQRLRREIHARAALEGRPIHEVVIELVEAGLQAQAAPPQTGEALFLPRHMGEALARQMGQSPMTRRPVKQDLARPRRKKGGGKA